MPLSSLQQELKSLIESKHPMATLESSEEERVDQLVSELAAEIKLPLFTWTATRGLQREGNPSTIYGTVDPLLLFRHMATLTVEGIFQLKDLDGHLTQPTTLRALKEAMQLFARSRAIILLTGTRIELPDEFATDTVCLKLPLPSHEELSALMRNVVESLNQQRRVEVRLKPEEHSAMMRALSGLTLSQARHSLTMAALSDGRISVDDIPQLVKRKGDTLKDTGLLEFYPPEEITLDLGGFPRLKSWLHRGQVGFGAEAEALGLRPPRGVLIVGVQGCGKSLAAKFVARQWQQPLLKLDAGRLYDKYIGESEKNLRKALEVAEAMSPSVLWIDEIEKAFASGGDTDGGLSRRMLGAFLTWMQERKAHVFVAATANDLSSLPPELLRKGRFDEIFFVDLPEAAEREDIFRIHLIQRRQRLTDFNVAALAAACDGFSGAEIEQALVAGLYRAIDEKTPLTDAMIIHELRQTVPLSVSRREDIERLRLTARDRFVPVR